MKLRDFQKLLKPAVPPPSSGTIMLRGRAVAFEIKRSKKRKRTIAFTVEPTGGIKVLTPVRAKLPLIEGMLNNRADWILKKIAEHEKARAKLPPRRYKTGEGVTYLGHAYQLQVIHDQALPQGCSLKPRLMQVNIRDGSLSEKALREEVRLEILLWTKKRARVKFKKRMDFWATQLGLSYKKLLITDPTRQWGSCTVDNVVRLNWRLMMAPLALLDYVVAHELCHVVHKNHSARFWTHLAAVMPDYQERRKELKLLGTGLVL